jgi:predicted nucleotidyltransferase
VTAGLGFLRQFNTTPISNEVRLARIERTRDAIVKVLSPIQIYVFGSAATGERFDSSSDIDCLAVLGDETLASRSWKRFGEIRSQLDWPVDLVVLSQSIFDKKRDLGGVAYIATHEGVLVYDSQAS